MKTLFWCDIQKRKRPSCVFLQLLGAIFGNQTTLGAIFARILRDFAPIFRDFDRISNKSELLGVRLHTLHPRLLYCTPASCTTR